VLVAVDVSDPSRAAATLGAHLARDLGVALTLAHIVGPLDVRRGSPVPGELEEQRLASARQPLEALARELSQVSADIVVRSGDVSSGIAELTVEMGPSIVVLGLGTMARAGSPRPGTVAYRVLCTARVPVLAVPEPSSL
jgi:nucleotide-binding universal stress UspA family protein